MSFAASALRRAAAVEAPALARGLKTGRPTLSGHHVRPPPPALRRTLVPGALVGLAERPGVARGLSRLSDLFWGCLAGAALRARRDDVRALEREPRVALPLVHLGCCSGALLTCSVRGRTAICQGRTDPLRNPFSLFAVAQMKHRKLKFGLAISGLLGAGFGLPLVACWWQFKKAMT